MRFTSELTINQGRLQNCHVWAAAVGADRLDRAGAASRGTQGADRDGSAPRRVRGRASRPSYGMEYAPPATPHRADRERSDLLERTTRNASAVVLDGDAS